VQSLTFHHQSASPHGVAISLIHVPSGRSEIYPEDSMKKLSETNQHNHSPRVISISSGKGGVGKTFLSIHLASRAVQRGLKVLLIDADLGLANVDVMLGITSNASIREVIDGTAAISDVIVTAPTGFDLLPGGSGLFEMTALSPDDQRVFLGELETVSANYDLLLIDNAAGIGENVLYFASSAQSVLVLLTSDPTSLTDAYALIKVMSHHRGVHRFMIVVNQAEKVEAKQTFNRLLKVSDHYLDVYLDYLGHIASSRDIVRSIQSQKTLFETASSPDLELLTLLLDEILNRPEDNSRSGRLQFFWQHSLHDALTKSEEG